MEKPHFPIFIASLAFFALCSVIGANAQSSFQISIGPLFTVNSTADTVDVNVGDGLCSDSAGRCTLRAAIEESNYEPVANVNSLNLIIFALQNPSVVNLTLGELPITGGVSIIGSGARRLTVQRSSEPGTPDFRVFRIASNGVGVEINRMSIRNGNAGTQDGGGILVEEPGTLTLTDVVVKENSAANGGGIANAGRRFVVNRVLINSNIATANGGGVFNQGSSPFSNSRISNSTITNNTATNGGAVYNTGSIDLTNDTISNNGATAAATSIFNEIGALNVLNTVIGRDAPSALSALSGTFITKGNNIVTDARNSTGFTNGASNDQVSDNNAIDPLIGPLADNGGQTDTRSLLAGSPAIDAGNDCVFTATCSSSTLLNGLSSDQRGRYLRKVGNAVDVGAFEANADPVVQAVSFGLTPRDGSPAFFSGAIAVLISATTNDRLYTGVNPFGFFRFQSIPADFYILEIKGKRARFGGGPFAIGLDEIPIGAPTSASALPESFQGFGFKIDR